MNRLTASIHGKLQELRNRWFQFQVRVKDRLFVTLILKLRRSFGEERSYFICAQTAHSLHYDMYHLGGESVFEFLRRKNLEFINQELYGHEINDHDQFYREAYSVHETIKRFLEVDEAQQLWPFLR